jgi:L-iditol 2-dehydrogenase
MKAIRLMNIHNLIMDNVPFPDKAEDQVLLRIASVGICGSDVHYFQEGGTENTIMKNPIILGHEFSAFVEAGDKKGQLVAVDPALPCGKCEFCLEGNPNFCENLLFAGSEGVDGGLKEYISWHNSAIFPLPNSITPEEGAMLEPLGVAIHALRLGKIFPGMDVGVFGTGPIGLLTIQMAKLAGAGRIFATDLLEHRLKFAADCGATDILPADGNEIRKIQSSTNGRGLDVTYETAGDDGAAVETAFQTAKRGGTSVLVGIPSKDETSFTASAARRRGLTIKLARRMKNTYPLAIRLVEKGMINLRPLITHRYSPENYQEAFDMAVSRKGIKVMINFVSDHVS